MGLRMKVEIELNDVPKKLRASILLLLVYNQQRLLMSKFTELEESYSAFKTDIAELWQRVNDKLTKLETIIAEGGRPDQIDKMIQDMKALGADLDTRLLEDMPPVEDDGSGDEEPPIEEPPLNPTNKPRGF